MKTKPIHVITITLVLITSMFLIISCSNSIKTQKSDVALFLNRFNSAVKSGDADSIKNYFDAGLNSAGLKHLTNILSGQNGFKMGSKPIINLTLDTDNSDIKFPSPDIANAAVEVILSHDSVETKHTILKLKIRKQSANQFKIIQVDGIQFLSDYVNIENLAKSKFLSEKDIYAEVTLKAFESAKQIKAKYDSIVWFSHIGKQSYLYVINGKWEIYNCLSDSAKRYKMGLLDPKLKEIIPVEYDLIHNINGTFNGLIEVEKAHKRGFYNLDGKIIIPVEYDQIFPVKNENAIGVLGKGGDFFWLRSDFSISDKVDLNISDILSQSPHTGSFTLEGAGLDNITEFNSHLEHGSIYIPPSYLADLKIVPVIQFFKNPLRKKIEFSEVTTNYKVNLDNDKNGNTNLFETAFYSIRDYFLGGRSEFYDKKNLVIIDKKRNRAFSHEINIDYTLSEGNVDLKCNEYIFKPVNDTLFEVKASAGVSVSLPDEGSNYLQEAPVYHYLYIKNNKLIEMASNRVFSFTKFIKMDDSYLTGCYKYTDKQTDYLKADYLQYIKNEIYADYHYKFKNVKWEEIFGDLLSNYKAENTSVDDSLTVIDKYNINWINQKLKQQKTNELAAK